jgi:hypothetical protein
VSVLLGTTAREASLLEDEFTVRASLARAIPTASIDARIQIRELWIDGVVNPKVKITT